MSHEARCFTLQEAKQLLPQVRQITEETVAEIERFRRARETAASPEELIRIAQAMDKAVARWTNRIWGLGCVPRGLWLVDFDSGSGYFCWQHGEEDIVFFRGYEEGFEDRVPIP